jgi:hypothetical protein
MGEGKRSTGGYIGSKVIFFFSLKSSKGHLELLLFVVSAELI